MAQYKTHSIFNIFIALPVFIWGIIYFFKPQINLLIIFSSCFTYATLFMNPDVDLANKIKLFSLKGILTLPFRGYSLIFKHRGLSHSILFGSLTRIVWLGSFFYLILFILNKPLFNKRELISLLKSSYFIYGIAAVILADICHLILDYKKIKIKL
ncbi:MAG: hypothetical protein ACD_7C00455G0004 [uncultured bacterium]|nr:MAG: hypothetical protein ACD_7C00455G0004 [uncultured bacterium]